MYQHYAQQSSIYDYKHRRGSTSSDIAGTGHPSRCSALFQRTNQVVQKGKERKVLDGMITTKHGCAVDADVACQVLMLVFAPPLSCLAFIDYASPARRFRVARPLVT